ncbi:MAG: HI1506-related protein [Nitrincola lacisaponensis]|uniref:HI1506-related protein n=1 Tax=Nitrincola lacisaponensis TaxID=267850 RepID=UPI00391CD0E6
MPIRITSAIEGFRRAGVAHPKSPTTYPDHFFTEEQRAQLEAEPRLVVEHIDADEITDPATDQTGTVEPDGVAGTVETTTTGESGEGVNLLQPLIDIIASLDPQDKTLWTKDGIPKASNFPAGTSAEDRANAWEMFKAGLDNQDKDA